MSFDHFDDTALQDFLVDPLPFTTQSDPNFFRTNAFGQDGGYLTSPLVGFKEISIFADPQIQQTLTPAVTLTSTHTEEVLDEINRFSISGNSGRPNNNVPSQKSKALGLNNQGFGFAQPPNMRIYGMPLQGAENQQSTAKSNKLGFLPYPDHIPTVTLGRGKKNVRDVGPLDLPAEVDGPAAMTHDPQLSVPVTTSQPLFQANSPSPTLAFSPPSQPLPKKRNKKSLAVKTYQNTSQAINANMSMPGTPRRNQRSVTTPVTPVSAHIGSFDIYADPKAPFNTPLTGDSAPGATVMPFSFDELFNLGLGVTDGGMPPITLEGTTLLNQDKQPQGFEDVLSPASLHSHSHLSPPSATLPGSASNNLSFSLLTSLPTPALLPSSCLSSPGSTWSTHSPLLSPQSANLQLGDGLKGQDQFIDPLLQEWLSPQFASLHSPLMSSPGTVTSPFSSYQTGSTFSSAEIPQSPFSPGTNNFAFLQQDPYARVAPGSEHTIRVAPSPKLNRKRSRLDLEADDSEYEASEAGGDEDDDEYIPCHPIMDIPVSKKQRVVSAPMPTSPRKLKPGPKPKNRAVSGYGAPAPQLMHRASSQDLVGHRVVSGDEQSEGDDNGSATGGVPKSVICSLYSLISGSTKSGGKKYLCLIEGCARTFPRKSAIESHIQTHLEDKPYVCSEADCGAAFVRQHDLRRHERIHSGTKPFPCPCGKGFARGDALMRHRQRGICVGSVVPRRS